MNRIDFNQVGGFPLSTNILDKLQSAFSIFNSLGNIVGDLSIISGCIVTGSNVGDGVVNINGEVLEFRGGPAQTKVIVREDAENLIFQNGNSYPSIKTRYVSFGTGVGAIDFVNFKRCYATKNIDLLIQRIVDLEARPTVGNIPIGLIALWGQAANLIPTGWQEHTDLRGRMPVGFDSTDVLFDVVGKQGGSKNKTLSVSEMPEHDHEVKPYAGMQGFNSNQNINSTVNGPSHEKTSKTGGGQEFSIMNPFRVVHFIRYVG